MDSLARVANPAHQSYSRYQPRRLPFPPKLAMTAAEQAGIEIPATLALRAHETLTDAAGALRALASTKDGVEKVRLTTFARMLDNEAKAHNGSENPRPAGE